jgi:hypothetical protein
MRSFIFCTGLGYENGSTKGANRVGTFAHPLYLKMEMEPISETLWFL